MDKPGVVWEKQQIMLPDMYINLSHLWYSSLFVRFGLQNIFLFPGFIQGVKMSLPIGFIRKDDKKFEEISIPATATSVGDIGRQLVPIADLDIIGQTAFQVQTRFKSNPFVKHYA